MNPGGRPRDRLLANVTWAAKLDPGERRLIREIVGDVIRGRVPHAVPVGDPGIAGQRDLVAVAAAAGVDWRLLQPHRTKGVPDAELARFPSRVADRCQPSRPAP